MTIGLIAAALWIVAPLLVGRMFRRNWEIEGS